jgi:hypothetical protein
MIALNQESFDRPESLDIARGKQLGRLRHYPDGDRYEPDGGRNGGMRAPKPRPIPPSTTLIRFGGFRDGASADRTQEQNEDHRKRDPKERASGPQYFARQVGAGEWWLDEFRYNLITAWANAKGESIAYAVRQLCAVPEEWSDMSYLVKARTRSPLMAYAGYGRPAETSNGGIDPRHDARVDIEQLFIPGLAAPDLCKQAIFIFHDQFLDPGMSKKSARGAAEREAAMRQRLAASVLRR